ncbi:MAG: hypothetical protein OXG08_12915 [Gammaproteobacteria bacterium]|nr:hypothetical protein [Gammaproteobacteria bacterium]
MEKSFKTLANSYRAGLLLIAIAVFVADVSGDSRVRIRLAGDIGEAAVKDPATRVHDSIWQNYSTDIRYIVERKTEGWSFDFHSVALANASNTSTEASVFGANRHNEIEIGRAWDLSAQLSSGSHHRISLFVDQLRVTYRNERWRVMLGRMPVFWGRGIVYQPLDVFNAHPPTTIDREFKRGNDSVVVERLMSNGSEVQFLSILRDSNLSSARETGTFAIKTYFPIEENELEFMLGKHYDASIVGVSSALPLGGMLLRADLATTCKDGCWTSAAVNVDYSWGVRGGILYTFIEFYYNGAGVSQLRDGLRNLPSRLASGIQRGEVFAYGRRVLAAGSSITWHALWTQSLTVLSNLNDRSVLLQTFFNHLPTDNLSMSFGIRVPFAGRNEEFGPLEVDDTSTIGGQAGVFFELSYYR